MSSENWVFQCKTLHCRWIVQEYGGGGGGVLLVFQCNSFIAFLYAKAMLL